MPDLDLSPEADDTDDGAWLDWPAVARRTGIPLDEMTPEQRRRAIHYGRAELRYAFERLW